jgi:hypothetical protein
MLTIVLLFLIFVVFTVNSSYRGRSAQTYPFSNNDDLLALKEVLRDVRNLPYKRSICSYRDFGEIYGTHKLCPYFERDHFPCYFISVGIEQDYTFDAQLAKQYHCTGLAMDPTVNHTENLLPGVKFMQVGANSPHPSIPGPFVSIPKLRKELSHPIFALKMDCEGCEYSLAVDIQKDDPDFFLSVLQFNFEVHLPKAFASADTDVYNLGRLFRLLYISGMQLVHVDDGRCGPNEQKEGCHALLTSVGFPCEPGCRSYLFAHTFGSVHEWKAVYASVNR